MTGGALTGTWHVIRLILRRDRWLLPLWVLVLGVLPATYTSSYDSLYPTAAERQQFALTSANSAGFVALYGRLNGSSLGELVAWRGGFLAVIVGLISILVVIRHTRTDEEAGRRELLASTVLGRHAGLAAALLVTVSADVALGLVSALTMLGQGLPVAGAFAYGSEMAAAGFIFAGVAAITAQLTTSAGSARGIAVGVLGGSYLMRVVGDVAGGADWLSWVSPIGLVQRMYPFGSNRWWVALIAVALTALLVSAGIVLETRRDLGSGLVPARPGRAAGGRLLASPLGLAWRLHRGLLIGWSAGFAALGVVLGGLSQSVVDLERENPAVADILERLGGTGGAVDVYIAYVMGVLGLIAAVYGVQAALKLRTEEAGQRAEPLLATAVSRWSWALSHYAFALLGPAAVLTVAGVATGLAYGVSTGDGAGQVPRVLLAAVIQLPAVWLVAAVVVAAAGLWPRFAAPAGWAAVLLCVLISLVGSALGVAQWVLDLSPFAHIPKLPGGQVSAVPLMVLLLLAAGLVAVGVGGLRRRDIPVG